jgi:hypothetical protein
MIRLGRDLYQRAKGAGLTGKRFQRLWNQVKGFSRYGFCHGHALAVRRPRAGHGLAVAPPPRRVPCRRALGRAVRVLAGVRGGGRGRAAGGARAGAVREPLTRATLAGGGPEPFARPRRPLLARPRAGSGGGGVRGDRGGAGTARGVRLARGPGPPLRVVPFARAGGMAGPLGRAGHPVRQPPGSALVPPRPAPGGRERKGIGGGRRTARAAVQPRLEMEVPPLLPAGGVPDFSAAERFSGEWQALGFSPGAHPMAFHREALSGAGVLSCRALQECQDGQEVTVGGLVLRPHRPPTPSGQVFVFLTLEDETGLAQVTIPRRCTRRAGRTSSAARPCW